MPPAAFTVRYGHEYLLYMYKGKLTPVAKEERGKIHTVFREQSRRHSQKPETAYQIIERLYPDAKKIELYFSSINLTVPIHNHRFGTTTSHASDDVQDANFTHFILLLIKFFEKACIKNFYYTDYHKFSLYHSIASLMPSAKLYSGS